MCMYMYYTYIYVCTKMIVLTDKQHDGSAESHNHNTVKPPTHLNKGQSFKVPKISFPIVQNFKYTLNLREGKKNYNIGPKVPRVQRFYCIMHNYYDDM